MRSLALLATSIFLGSAMAASLIPLSPSTYAFQRGNESSKINAAIFIDLSCSDTKAVWDTLNKVYDNYKGSVNFLYHVFPLPYHQYAFVLSKAAHVVDAYGDQGAVFHYFDTVFANQEQISNSATAGKTYDEMVAFIGKWATDGTGVTQEEYVQGMKNSNIEMNTRYMWKYCTLHSVFGTPLYSINGIMDLGLTTYQQWANTLDGLIEQQSAASTTHFFH